MSFSLTFILFRITTSSSAEDFLESPTSHNFPLTEISNTETVHIEVLSLPRMDVSRLLFLMKQENNLMYTFDGGGTDSGSPSKRESTNNEIAKDMIEKKMISSKKIINFKSLLSTTHRDSNNTSGENCSKRKDLNFDPTVVRQCGEKCIKLEHDLDVCFSRTRTTMDSNENHVLIKSNHNPNNNRTISALSNFLNYNKREDSGSSIIPDIERTFDNIKKTSLSLSQLLEGETTTKASSEQKPRTSFEAPCSSSSKDESLSSLLQDFAFNKKVDGSITDGDEEDEDEDDEDLECYNYDDEITPERLVNDEHLNASHNLKPCPRNRSKSVSPNFVQRQKV